MRHNGYDWHKSCWEEYEELVPTCTFCGKPITDAKSLDEQWHAECYAANSNTPTEATPPGAKEVVAVTVDLVRVLFLFVFFLFFFSSKLCSLPSLTLFFCRMLSTPT